MDTLHINLWINKRIPLILLILQTITERLRGASVLSSRAGVHLDFLPLWGNSHIFGSFPITMMCQEKVLLNGWHLFPVNVHPQKIKQQQQNMCRLADKKRETLSLIEANIGSLPLPLPPQNSSTHNAIHVNINPLLSNTRLEPLLILLNLLGVCGDIVFEDYVSNVCYLVT